MLNPAHILEIALLLLVAFLIGAVVGSLARLAVARLIPTKVPAPSPVVGDATVVEASKAEEAPALVAAPVIGELAKTPTPVAPADVPAPDFTEALLALAGDKPGSLASKIRMPSIAPLPVVSVTKAAGEMKPARVAGETTSGRVVLHPRTSMEPARAVAPDGAGAEVIPFPLEKVTVESSEPPVVVVATPMPLAEPALPLAAEPDAPVIEAEVAVEPVAAVENAPPVEAEVQPEAVTAVETATVAPVEVPAVDPEVAADVVALVTPAEQEPAAVGTEQRGAPPAPEPAATAAPEPVIAAAPEPGTEDDEAAAMRAIEGNWSPRRAASPRSRKATLPEMADDQATPPAAEAIVIEAPGKPAGIPAPRLGAKDDLTHVIGILPIIETALNNLGLFHFDQVAELTDENAGWIENHLGIAGRIGREHWREQARELALATGGAKKAAGQQ